VARAEDGSGGSYGGGWPGCDAWDLQGAGGGTDWVVATASSSEERLGQTARRCGTAGRGQRGSGKAMALGGGGMWLSPEQRRGGGGAAHGRQSGGGARAKKQRRWEGGRRRRTEKQNPKNTGTPLQCSSNF
jgi:hypothetical protein